MFDGSGTGYRVVRGVALAHGRGRVAVALDAAAQDGIVQARTLGGSLVRHVASVLQQHCTRAALRLLQQTEAWVPAAAGRLSWQGWCRHNRHVEAEVLPLARGGGLGPFEVEHWFVGRKRRGSLFISFKVLQRVDDLGYFQGGTFWDDARLHCRSVSAYCRFDVFILN